MSAYISASVSVNCARICLLPSSGPKANTSIKRQWLSYVKNLLKPYYRNKLLDRNSFTEVCKKVIKPYDFKDVTSVPDTMHELATLTYYYAVPRLEMSRKELRSKAIQASRDLAAIGLADPKKKKLLQVKRHIYKQRLEDARRRIHECKSYKPASRMHATPGQSAITRKPPQSTAGELPGMPPATTMSMFAHARLARLFSSFLPLLPSPRPQMPTTTPPKCTGMSPLTQGWCPCCPLGSCSSCRRSKWRG